MSNAFRGPGETLTLAAPYDRSSGQGALVGDIFGVACQDVLSGVDGQFAVCGVFELTKTTSQAWAVGDRLHWDIANKKLSTDAATGPLVGVCDTAAASDDAVGLCKLNDISAERLFLARQGSPAPTSKATAGAVTLTIAELLTGVLVVDCAGAGRTYTLPTAALLIAGVPGAKVGDLLRCKVINGSDAAETITLAEGSGGGWDANQTAGSRVIPQNSSKDVLIRVTNVTASSEAYVVYA